MSEPRKVHVKSFGCQMNVYDSNRMADTLAPGGYVETARPEDADLVILNTCHIREKAVDKVYSEIGRIRVMKEEAAREGRQMLIAVAGCVAQAEGQEIVRRAHAVDLVVGSQNYHKLPEMIARARSGERVVDTEFPVEDKFDALAAPKREAIRKRGLAAFVTTEPWATLLAVGALYIISIPLSIHSYRRLRRAAEELRAGGLRASVDAVHHTAENH